MRRDKKGELETWDALRDLTEEYLEEGRTKHLRLFRNVEKGTLDGGYIFQIKMRRERFKVKRLFQIREPNLIKTVQRKYITMLKLMI